MTRFTTLLIAMLFAALAAVPAAGAASIAYVAGDGNVHLVAPDGSRDVQLTADASADNKYRSPSQLDDGRVVALRHADGSTAFAYFLRREDGHVLDAWLLPKSGSGGFSPFTGAEASPQGGMIVYDYRHFDCGSYPCSGDERVGFVAGSGQTNPCLVNCYQGYLAPRWVPGTPYAAMVDEGFNAVYVQKEGSAYPVDWYSYGEGISVEGVDVRGGRIVTTAKAGETEYMVLDKTTGAPPALPQTQCSVNMPDGSHPRLSPDGSMIAWTAPEGVMVSPTPTQSGGTGTLCQLTPKLIAAGGSQPDWGVADVPAAASTSAPGASSPAKKDPPALTGVTVPRLATALGKGLAVGFRCAAACKVEAAASVAKPVARRYGLGRAATKVGSGRAALTAAGSGKVRVDFTAKAKRKLAGAGNVPLTVTLLVDDGSGKRQLSKSVTLREGAGRVARPAALPLRAQARRFSLPRVKQMTLAVEITGLHQVRWHLQDEGYPDPKRIWYSGKGSQTLGFSTPKPVTYRAAAMSGTTPDGTRLTPLALTPSAVKPMKGSLRRKYSGWQFSDGDPCDREGGCEVNQLIPPLHHNPSCPERRLGVPATLETGATPDGKLSVLQVSFSPLSLEGLWPECPPDMDGVSRPLTLAQPHTVALAGGIKAIAHLAKGQSVTLKGAFRRGASDASGETASCPTLSGAGKQECAVTDVTVEVKRLR